MYARDIAVIATPVGMVRIEGNDDWIDSIAIEPGSQPERCGTAHEVRKAAEQLRGYFAGERQQFGLHLRPLRSVRGQALRDGMIAVGYAQTERYGEMARRVASSARAVGQACARNALPIVVPCHRILGGSGHYSAGDGLATKNWLLDHEQFHHRH